VVPDAGGDTMWVDTAAAYEALSPTMQKMIERLHVHYKIGAASMDRLATLVDAEGAAKFRAAYANGVDHPLVRRNPDSGRLALFVAGYWMDHIVGMLPDESEPLLRFLNDHAAQPRFQCRWRWSVDDLVIWDERRTMHLAVPDHYPRHRKLRRCTVVGEVPVGV
jgi:taurine dioxygenase